jgi:hypothetical protein
VSAALHVEGIEEVLHTNVAAGERRGIVGREARQECAMSLLISRLRIYRVYLAQVAIQNRASCILE